jgi:hypothetical protein
MSDVGFLSRLSLTSARRGSRGSPYAQRARPNSPLTRRKGAIRQRFKIDEIAKSRKSPFFRHAGECRNPGVSTGSGGTGLRFSPA